MELEAAKVIGAGLAHSSWLLAATLLLAVKFSP